MTALDHEFEQAEDRAAALREHGYAVAARYDDSRARIVIELNNSVEIAFPPQLAEGLAGASAGDLADIVITPTGLGLHWPKLDADLYVPALLQGVFGTKRWMAAQLGAAGGKARTQAKVNASRENGRKGGRPRSRAV